MSKKLVRSIKFFASSEDFRVTNGIVGSVAKNPFLVLTMSVMSKPELARPGQNVIEATSPYLLDKALKAYIKERRPKGYKNYHPKFFNPKFFSWKEGPARTDQIKKFSIHEIQSRFPECIFVHMFSAEWVIKEWTN